MNTRSDQSKVEESRRYSGIRQWAGGEGDLLADKWHLPVGGDHDNL